MELDATLSGTASEVSVLVSVRASSEKQGTADKVAHQRPRNAMTELNPTLQGSVDQEIPAQLTQVDLAQDGQFHDLEAANSHQEEQLLKQTTKTLASRITDPKDKTVRNLARLITETLVADEIAGVLFQDKPIQCTDPSTQC
ncbi:hypothetical protein H4Q26_017624 [Puccinia striiformis f. sp. tritici PST-130]|nr:hypothetical protein H4Q26_017624 [Puccinia striiformis f. sp. tritici PST-130]